MVILLALGLYDFSSLSSEGVVDDDICWCVGVMRRKTKKVTLELNVVDA